MIKKVEYLVIGQGLAGTMMAFHLLETGKSVCVVDNGEISASMVAAGLFNPVTGRRFVRSWNIEKLLPYADKVYPSMEKLLDRKFYFKKPIIKILSGNEEKMVYDRSLTIENKPYIEGFYSATEEAKYSTCEIKEGGFVDTSLMIGSFREYLQKKDAFIKEDFYYNDLIINPEGIQWKDVHADNIIFCEGYKAIDNPLFPDLPFNLAKGEILTLKIPGLNPDKVLMAGGYLVPVGDDIFKLGSTYAWDDMTTTPTPKGREDLITKLKDIADLSFEIVNHEAGIRPAVKNRRPIVGRHPDMANVFILNGMGTKGVLLAPYFAKQLSDLLLFDNEVDSDVDVSQYLVLK